MNRDHAQLGLPWLLRARWMIFGAGALGAAAARSLFGVEIDTPRALLFLAAGLASNAVFLFAKPSQQHRARIACAFLLAFDTALLTAFLFENGGPSNPFSVLYLVYITLAALLVGPAWTWALALSSVAAYGGLFFAGSGSEGTCMECHHGDAFAGHLRAMWVAYSLTAALTAGAVTKLTDAIRRREEELEAVRDRAARSERVASLTTLAAGTAHELGTPLGTIALAAEELERRLRVLDVPDADSLRHDAGLIRSELARCRRILDQMSTAAGEFVGEAPTPLPLAALLEEVRESLGEPASSRIRVRCDLAGNVVLPHRAFVSALANLLRNACDAASGPRDGFDVDLVASRQDDGSLHVLVDDRGPGMAPETLAMAFEPFFTTKAPGKGMGMGLFLARALVERLGGTLTLESRPGRGTTARIELPSSVLGGAAVAAHG